MEKTISINGRDVNFKCTAGTLRRYRNQFNREFLSDLSKLKDFNDNFESFTFAPLENIIWTMAKTADNTIPDPQTWYDSFDNFPVAEVFGELQDLIIASMKSKN